MSGMYTHTCNRHTQDQTGQQWLHGHNPLKGQLLRILNDRLEFQHELCCTRSIHNAVIACQIAFHDLLNTKPAIVIHSDSGLAASNCQNGCCACITNRACTDGLTSPDHHNHTDRLHTACVRPACGVQWETTVTKQQSAGRAITGKKSTCMWSHGFMQQEMTTVGCKQAK